MLDFKAGMQDTTDTKEIQEFARKAAAEILVGFPSGRQHVPTHHKSDREKPNAKRRGKLETIDHGDIRDEEPIDIAELAKMLSFGTDRIPARPFLEDAIKSKKDELDAEIKNQIQKVKNGGRANWDKVGTMAVGAVQEFVRSDYYKSRVPNSKNTIEYKGSDTPLIDGGDLVNACVYLIKDAK